MGRLLVFLHTEEEGKLGRTAFEALTAAREVCEALNWDDLIVAVIGAGADKATAELSGFPAKQVVVLDAPEFSKPRYSTDSLAAYEIVTRFKPDVVVGPNTSRFQRALPGGIYRAGGKTDTHICAVFARDRQLFAKKWIYRQRIEVTFTRTSKPWGLLVEPGAFKPAKMSTGSVGFEKIVIPIPEGLDRTVVLEVKGAISGVQTVRPDADLLFVAGAGWTKKQSDGQIHLNEAEELIKEFLELTGASLGSTKSLVDLSAEGAATLSFLTPLNQVGQTGSTPRHPRGLATCCHGEEPHTVGWRFINERRAINLDPNCGWARGKADVLYVADAFAVIRKVNELLRQLKK